jgi:BD-FAE
MYLATNAPAVFVDVITACRYICIPVPKADTSGSITPQHSLPDQGHSLFRMRFNHALCILCSLLLLTACSDSNDSSYFQRPALDLPLSVAPVDLPGISAQFAADIPYGPYERNLFNIFLPDCEEPTPLIVYIHGGGFTGGNKESYSEEQIREALQQCVAWATIGYRLLPPRSDVEHPPGSENERGVIVSLGDSARALQFMRYHYQSLNLDPENVAVWGRSAGAGTALWLGTHDDMADPFHIDPVLRESTRVKAVGALATQATYDILGWETVLQPLVDTLVPSVFPSSDFQEIAASLKATGYLLRFLGATTFEQLYTPEYLAYRENVDMLKLMDSGDAPIFVANNTPSLGNPLGFILHHSLHALAVKARADEVGLESVGYSTDPAWPLEDPSGEELTSFLLGHIR